MEYFRKSKEETLTGLKTSEKGLTTAEASIRIEKYGKNALAEEEKKGVIGIFLEQFKDLLVGILIVAGLISMFSGQIESTIVIFAVITLNAVLGTVQHFKAEKSLEGLKRLSAPTARVIRNGVRVEIPSEELTVGDIISLEAGDLVTADARIIENFSLKVKESSLTGESESVEKMTEAISDLEVPLGDRKNMVFSSSLVTYGRALAAVTSIGMETELGKIAALLNKTKERKTPLQISLDKFSRKLAIIIIGICIVVFGLSIYRQMPVIDAMLFAVALAVAAIPEALSSIVTIVLAMGTSKMAKENAIMKELKAAESLGSVSVICSDKTGTLTKNKMEVQEIYTTSGRCRFEELNLMDSTHYMLIKESILVNDADVSDGKELGDPTETALLNMAEVLGIDTEMYREQHNRLSELAFDSDRKLMSTLHHMEGENILCTKGALDVLMSRTSKILTPQGVVPITSEYVDSILKANQELSQKGLRVLAFAYRSVGDRVDLEYTDEEGYTFVGLISMMDPPRDEAIKAVADAKKGGIRTIMITGDHKITASAIAKKIGIMSDGDIAVEGIELDKMTDEELDRRLENIVVYARVSPEHKIRIVDAWQRKGKLVSMTGDGVNDAPALKQADIGVAMGITGTEVAKDAASMILTDDNFATIVKAVVNGRGMYANIKHAIEFLLSGNMAGILGVLFASLAGLPVPFLPVHLLFINLLTDSLPALAIGMENADKELLNQPPRDVNKSVLDKTTMLRVGYQGLLMAIATMTAFFIGLASSDGLATTMAFATLTLSRLFHGFNCRSEQAIFKIGFRSNVYSIGAFVLGVALLGIVLFVPFFKGLFSVIPLGLINSLWIILLSAVPTIMIQGIKLIKAR